MFIVFFVPLFIAPALNCLARALFFEKRGELRERGLLQDQLQRASALTL